MADRHALLLGCTCEASTKVRHVHNLNHITTTHIAGCPALRRGDTRAIYRVRKP
jgi:hypothetical protein